MTQQHYRMTLNNALSDYQAGLISATTLVYYYFRIRLAPGWKIERDWQKICSELGISKASFYKALQRLKEKKLLEFNIFRKVVATLSHSQQVEVNQTETLERQEDKVETLLDKTETLLDKTETLLDKVETKKDKVETLTSVKPLSNKIPKQQPSFSSSSFQSFFYSLSETTRESFLNFVREKIKDFKPQINDVCGWLAGKNQAGEYRWLVYYKKFQNEIKEAIPLSQDWQNHPLWKKALDFMRQGVTYFLVRGNDETDLAALSQETRQKMFEYAQSQKLLPGW